MYEDDDDYNDYEFLNQQAVREVLEMINQHEKLDLQELKKCKKFDDLRLSIPLEDKSYNELIKEHFNA